jgi:hypothetical protein
VERDLMGIGWVNNTVHPRLELSSKTIGPFSRRSERAAIHQADVLVIPQNLNLISSQGFAKTLIIVRGGYLRMPARESQQQNTRFFPISVKTVAHYFAPQRSQRKQGKPSSVPMGAVFELEDGMH